MEANDGGSTRQNKGGRAAEATPTGSQVAAAQ